MDPEQLAGIWQCLPEYSTLQRHIPSKHAPCPEQFVRQAFSAQLGPAWPAKQWQRPSASQRPAALQSSGQKIALQSSPPRPALQTHLPSAPQKPNGAWQSAAQTRVHTRPEALGS